VTVEAPLRDAESVHGYLRRICFKTGPPPSRVGAELEWLVARSGAPRALVPLTELEGLLRQAGPFPGASRVTLEPGGQVELSSVPAEDLSGCLTALGDDVAHLRTVLRSAGLDLVPSAIDPHRPPVRQLRAPRYDAMADYFDTLPHTLGRVMMASTAAVQVNLDAGADDRDVARRWRLLHTVGPALCAAFANSPRHNGRRTGWKSTRQAVWLGLDPRRTHAPPGREPVSGWAAYALAAPVMMLRSTGTAWRAAPGFTFGEWVTGRVPDLRRPTEDDLAYHLTTLFPPVRPRGWFEVRFLDAQDPAWWPVPVAVLATLLDHRSAGDRAAEACEPVADRWVAAARHGPADRDLALAARRVFAAVVGALADTPTARLVSDFSDRYVSRGRCPADDDPAPTIAAPRRLAVPEHGAV
jgi:glutamate--cysteine ligase